MAVRTIIFRGKRIDNGEWVSRISSMSKSAQAAVIEDYLQRGKTGGKEYA